MKMLLNGIGVRGIERETGINHNSMLNWVRQVAAGMIAIAYLYLIANRIEVVPTKSPQDNI